MTKKSKQWDSEWTLCAAAKEASDVPDSRTIEEAIEAAVAGTTEQLAELVTALAEQVEAVAVRLGELEEASGEGAGKRAPKQKVGRDVLGRRRTGASVVRRVAKSKQAPEPRFSFRPPAATARFPGTVPAVLAAAMRGAEQNLPADPDRDPWGRYRPGRSVPKRDERGRAVR